MFAASSSPKTINAALGSVILAYGEAVRREQREADAQIAVAFEVKYKASEAHSNDDADRGAMAVATEIAATIRLAAVKGEKNLRMTEDRR